MNAILHFLAWFPKEDVWDNLAAYVFLPLIAFESVGRLQSFFANGVGGGNVSKIIKFLQAS